MSKYVLLGRLNPEWAARRAERAARVRAKLAGMGLVLEATYDTDGAYDFVDVVEMSERQALPALASWYAKQGFGALATLPVSDLDSLPPPLGETDG